MGSVTDLPAVLLVDDEPINLRALGHLLADLDLRVVSAASGQEALDLAGHQEFALLLVDVVMPGLSGIETVSRLRADGLDTPVIFITARVTDEAGLLASYQAGAVDHILRPFQPDVLRAKVNVFLDLYRQQRELEDVAARLTEALVQQAEEIDRRRRVEEGLRLAATVFDNLNEAILVTDARGVIQSVNPAFSAITGYSSTEAVGQTPALLRSGRHSPLFYHALWQTLTVSGQWVGEIWNRRKNGQVYPQWISISAIRREDGSVAQYAAVFSDITERKRYEEAIHHKAYHDLLTGLPNRELYADRFQQAVAQVERAGGQLGVCYLDLDDFKGINDRWGHDVGDRLLQEVAQRLKGAVRRGDTVARFGGDEFVLLLLHPGGKTGMAAIAAKILQAMASPVVLGQVHVHPRISIGGSLYPGHGKEMDELLRRADEAMYRVKARPRKNGYELASDEG